MKIFGVISGFIPFVAFSLLVKPIGAGWAALAGFGAAVLVVAVTAKGGIKILPSLQAGLLLVMAVWAFSASPSVRAELVKYGPAAAAVIIGFFIVVTAARMPFTAQLARQDVPRTLWHDPRFLDVNRRISSVWGLAILVAGVCGLTASVIDPDNSRPLLGLAVSWVLPIVAFWQAAAYTQRLKAAVADRMRQAHAQAPSGTSAA